MTLPTDLRESCPRICYKKVRRLSFSLFWVLWRSSGVEKGWKFQLMITVNPGNSFPSREIQVRARTSCYHLIVVLLVFTGSKLGNFEALEKYLRLTRVRSTTTALSAQPVREVSVRTLCFVLVPALGETCFLAIQFFHFWSGPGKF